jgi:hypothetical protein
MAATQCQFISSMFSSCAVRRREVQQKERDSHYVNIAAITDDVTMFGMGGLYCTSVHIEKSGSSSMITHKHSTLELYTTSVLTRSRSSIGHMKSQSSNVFTSEGLDNDDIIIGLSSSARS